MFFSRSDEPHCLLLCRPAVEIKTVADGVISELEVIDGGSGYSSTDPAAIATTGGTGGGCRVHITALDRTGTDLLVLSNAGNVGIGTTSPGAKLEVDDSGATNTVELLVGTDDPDVGRISVRASGASITNTWDSTMKIKAAHSNDRGLTVLDNAENYGAILGDVSYAAYFWGENVRVHDGSYNGGHLPLGGYHLWVDSSGKLRIYDQAPSNDDDGVVVGDQTA